MSGGSEYQADPTEMARREAKIDTEWDQAGRRNDPNRVQFGGGFGSLLDSFSNQPAVNYRPVDTPIPTPSVNAVPPQQQASGGTTKSGKKLDNPMQYYVDPTPMVPRAPTSGSLFAPANFQAASGQSGNSKGNKSAASSPTGPFTPSNTGVNYK